MTALQDIELRLQCAEDQLDALSADIEQTMKSDAPADLRVERNVSDETFSIYFKELPDVRREWGIWLGGFLHNVRSSLDHCVAGLVVANSGSVHKRHQFPIADAEHQWDDMVNPKPSPKHPHPRGQLDDVAPQHVALIKSYQPYDTTTGYKSLATLRDFSNADKHRLLHSAVTLIHPETAPSLVGSATFPLLMSEVTFPPPRARLDSRTEIARFKASNVMIINTGPRGDIVLSDASQMNVNLNVTVGTAFGEEGNETTGIKAFRDCLSDVRGIMQKFAAELS